MTVLPFRRPKRTKTHDPDPANGRVYVSESFDSACYPGRAPSSWMWVHESASGDSLAIGEGYTSREEAEAGALLEARKRNCVFA